ncbi:unnamed protein product [Euphydryas editha]|uniref:Uncharacterized protein n=1 Tax=Euphydryas editha TaxID=104508 RepID=A0AAU9VE65_EUPED|nr:unnamed protein product [Euphydryas editha]
MRSVPIIRPSSEVSRKKTRADARAQVAAAHANVTAFYRPRAIRARSFYRFAYTYGLPLEVLWNSMQKLSRALGMIWKNTRLISVFVCVPIARRRRLHGLLRSQTVGLIRNVCPALLCGDLMNSSKSLQLMLGGRAHAPCNNELRRLPALRLRLCPVQCFVQKTFKRSPGIFAGELR